MRVFFSPQWNQEAREACQRVNNHGWCGVHLGATGFLFYLFFAGLLMLLFALFTALMMKLVKKYSHTSM